MIFKQSKFIEKAVFSRNHIQCSNVKKFSCQRSKLASVKNSSVSRFHCFFETNYARQWLLQSCANHSFSRKAFVRSFPFEAGMNYAFNCLKTASLQSRLISCLSLRSINWNIASIALSPSILHNEKRAKYGRNICSQAGGYQNLEICILIIE